MSLFQKSVINKYLKNLDNEKVSKAFENFQKFYGDKLRLHNIMQLKEENYQEGFLREIFVETLGYTINPDNDFNLTTEFKNLNDARKADGAILRDGKAIGVIELKSTKTKHLESIKEQAFSYKNNQPGCRYVITSNFQSLRFYIDDAAEYEEFDLFRLAGNAKIDNKKTDEAKVGNKSDGVKVGNKTDGLTRRFKLFYLLLSKESIFSDLPERLKQETKFHENDISAQLYTDYKRFKNKIFENLVKNNPQYDKLLLFKKSQKLLDRFLFVFFAEDSGLIPPNAVSKIIEQWKQLQELDEYKPLYTRFQKLFAHLDKGHKYEKWGEIPAYNGGLFRNDELLDSNKLIIDDEVLEKDSLTLSAYDFNTEVDVNILGHIFEHSLNEIENITAQLQGEEIDKKKTKRKKDGIFYTPKYITKYIVENTVGTLCKEKKEELQIDNIVIDSSFYKNRRVNPSVRQDNTSAESNQRVNSPVIQPVGRKLNVRGKKLFKTLNDYKNWLLTLKILDPACGSGAFLNATLDFLITEHKQIDNLIAELTGDALGLFDTDKAILENNIYGVDINEESVEIAKLSMWLRTAQKGRPLSDLSGNIKCGNSLIDDPEVAGDKAFDWYKEFPQIFKKKEKRAWHITFAIHNSRYSTDADGLTRRYGGVTNKTPGFIARTYPELNSEQEIILAEELEKAAKEYDLNITECNICKDHVHALIVCEEEELSGLVGKWKGRTAFTYNRRVNPSIDTQKAEYYDGTKQKLWAKSYNAVSVKDKEQYSKTVNYIKNNRKKHELPPATDGLTRPLTKMRCTTEHAFRKEYKGGFDVVMGNPPYVRIQNLKENDVNYFSNNYQSAKGKFDIYLLFNELSLRLIKQNGLIGFIEPHKFLVADFGKNFRKFVLHRKSITKIISFSDIDIFKDAVTYTCLIFLKKHTENTFFKYYEFSSYQKNQIEIDLSQLSAKSFLQVFYDNLSDNQWVLTNNSSAQLVQKLNQIPLKLSDITTNLSQGVIPGSDKIYYLKFIKDNGNTLICFSEQKKQNIEIEKEILKPIIKGNNVKRYLKPVYDYYIIYPYKIIENEQEIIPFKELQKNYPLTAKYFNDFKDFLINLRIKYKTNPEFWYGFHRAREMNFLETEKILTSHASQNPNFTYTETNFYYNQNVYGINLKPNIDINYIQLLGLLNSNICNFFIRNTSSMIKGGYYLYKTDYLVDFPIINKINTNKNQQTFIRNVNLMLSLNKELQNKSDKFIKRIKSNLEMQKITGKLQNFYNYDFKTFITELKKQKIKLSFKEQDDWEEYFEDYKKEINELQTRISQTDKEIDKMVYELYGLTEEEILIVEGSVK